MQCPNCGKEIEKAWNYCPGCGARFRRDFFSSIFNRMFSRMDRELKEMDRLMEKNIEALDISPFFIRPFRAQRASPPLGTSSPRTGSHGKDPNAQNRQQDRPFRAGAFPSSRRENVPASAKPRGSGFSIKIRRLGNSPPRVSVRTFGNMDRDKVREQVQKQLGIRLRPEAAKIPEKPPETKGQAPKSVEEPKTDVKRLDSKVVVNLEMPGVKSPDDIDIKELESSLEVKATAGDRAYFKILTKPGRFRLTNRGFSRGVLHLEFS